VDTSDRRSFTPANTRQEALFNGRAGSFFYSTWSDSAAGVAFAAGDADVAGIPGSFPVFSY
jgi:hypothetical protein